MSKQDKISQIMHMLNCLDTDTVSAIYTTISNLVGTEEKEWKRAMF